MLVCGDYFLDCFQQPGAVFDGILQPYLHRAAAELTLGLFHRVPIPDHHHSPKGLLEISRDFQWLKRSWLPLHLSTITERREKRKENLD